MPTCAVKNCTHNTRNSLKKDGVSYFIFPKDPKRRSEWSTIIRESRGEEFYEPPPSSHVCSYHFASPDMYITNKGFARLAKGAKPTLHLCDEPDSQQPSAARPRALAVKRTCRKLKAGTTHKPQKLARLEDASSTDSTAAALYINAYDPEGRFKKELPLHPDIRCKVCNSDIIGFRYTCVQCAHWDMCATCEARGEHPAHYVLRLPAPKPREESEAVLSSIRKHIEELLALKNEMHEIFIKEESIEVKQELELDVTEHNPIPELNDSIVPEVHVQQNSSATVASDGCINSVCTDAATRHARADEPGQSQERNAAMLRDIKQEPQEDLDNLVIDEACSKVKTEGNLQIIQKPSSRNSVVFYL